MYIMTILILVTISLYIKSTKFLETGMPNISEMDVCLNYLNELLIY